MSQNKNSQYDPGLVVKEVHDFYGQAIRVRDTNSLNSQYFTHFSATYDVNNNPTQVIYYRGVTSHITNIGCVADVAGSLNNKYFTLRACPSNFLYHVWFNVDGAGIAPIVANSTGIEVQINQNDPAIVISTAVRLTLNTLYPNVFKASQTGATLEIRTVGVGVCSNSADVNTGFAIANTQGTQVVTDTVNISYSGTDPIYNGQVLKGHKYNIWGGNFEFVSSSSATIVGDVNSIMIGTENGTTSGTQYVVVNNIRQQILASHDREQLITYADFGTKNQRIVQVDYSSPTFIGFTAQKVITYTLVSGRYRRDSINWSVI